MAYRRYDLKNRYNSKGERISANTAVYTLLLILIPFLMVLILVGSILIAVFTEYGTLNMSYNNIYDANSGVTDKDLLRVVNMNNPLDSDFVPALVKYDAFQISPVMEEDLKRLIYDAESEGFGITVTVAYVSYDEQGTLYNATIKNFMANDKYSEVKAESETRKVCPESGCSESQTGLLIKFSSADTKGDFSKTKAYSWLERNAINYGFILRYPEGEEVVTDMNYAPDLFRYVGKEHALNMRRYDMTLEEYNYHYCFD